jgi:hypothetical protein
MEGQLRALIRQKIIDSLAAAVPSFTRRDVRLPDTDFIRLSILIDILNLTFPRTKGDRIM